MKRFQGLIILFLSSTIPLKAGKKRQKNISLSLRKRAAERDANYLQEVRAEVRQSKTAQERFLATRSTGARSKVPTQLDLDIEKIKPNMNSIILNAPVIGAVFGLTVRALVRVFTLQQEQTAEEAVYDPNLAVSACLGGFIGLALQRTSSEYKAVAKWETLKKLRADLKPSKELDLVQKNMVTFLDTNTLLYTETEEVRRKLIKPTDPNRRSIKRDNRPTECTQQ